MDTSRIASEIDAQIARLQQARKLLSGDTTQATTTTAKGRPNARNSERPGARKGHTVSVQARAKITAAQRARWARQKASKKK